MSMYDLIESSNNYSKTSVKLWKNYRDELRKTDNAARADSRSFKSKVKITGKTLAAGNSKDVEIAVPLTYLSNFWGTFEMLLSNCKLKFILVWSANCVIIYSTGAGTSAITDSKVYVPVVTSSTQDNAKLLQQFKSGFTRTISWNKYQSKVKIEKKAIIRLLSRSKFSGVNRLFVLSLEDNATRTRHTRHFLPTVEIKDYNVTINGQNFFDQSVKKWYKNIS